MLSRRKFIKSLPVLTLPGLAFKISSPPPIKLRFAVASDGHFGQKDTDYETFHKDLIRWMNQERVQKGLDFLILNGDIIHDEPTLLYDAKMALKNLNIPYFVNRGNHDRVGNDVWESTWGYPTNHSFTRNNVAFILADTSNEKGKYLCADVKWLKEELSKHAGRSGIYVFMHISQKTWVTHGIDCAEVCNLLESTPNVKGIFHGHDHDQDGGKVSGGKPYFFDGHFGGSWGTHYKGYRIVEIYEDDSWRTYQYNPTAEPILNSYEFKS